MSQTQKWGESPSRAGRQPSEQAEKDRYVSRYTVRYPGREAGIIPEVVTVGEVTKGSGCERGHREISGSKLKGKCVKRGMKSG